MCQLFMRRYDRRHASPHACGRLRAGARVFLAAAAVVVIPNAGAHRLPKAPGCPILPKSNAFNPARGSASGGERLGHARQLDRRRCALPCRLGSGTYDGGPIGIPYTVVGKGQKKVPVTFEYADESDRGPYPIPPRAPIEGGPNADGDRHGLPPMGLRVRLKANVSLDGLGRQAKVVARALKRYGALLADNGSP